MRALVVAVILGGAFGTATATVDSLGDEMMVVEIEVEVRDPGESVVAHLEFEEEELILPLIDRGDGVFGIRTELKPKNYVVVFETIGANGQSSAPTTLAQMGAELTEDVEGAAGTSDDEGLSDVSRSFLWLAIALGAASLSALAFWVLGGRDDEDESEPGTDPANEEE